MQDAAGSAEGRSRGLEESRSILEPVTISFSMKCDATALAGRKDALEAALRKVATEFDGLDFRLGRTVVGPSDETLQKILPLVLEHVGVPGVAAGDFVWPFLQVFHRPSSKSSRSCRSFISSPLWTP